MSTDKDDTDPPIGESSPLLQRDDDEKQNSEDTDDESNRPTSSHESLIEDESVKDKNLSKAAYMIRNVIIGDPHVGGNWSYSPYNEGTSPSRNKAFYFAQGILSNRYFMSFIYLTYTALVFLSFFEQPFWCLQNGREDDGRTCDNILQSHGTPAFLTDYEEDAIVDMTSVDVAYYPTWNIAILSPMESYAIDFFCVMVLICYVILLVIRDGSSLKIFFATSTVLRIVLVSSLSIMLINLTLIRTFQFSIGAINSQFLVMSRTVPLFLRVVIYSTFSPSVISEIRRMLHLIPHLLNIMVVLFVLILIYAWIGNIIFFGTDEGLTSFNSLADSIWTLWQTLTETYPDSFLPIYNEHRLSSIYFTSYMILANIFLMNVILSAIYENYTNLREGFTAKQQEEGLETLKEAYKLLKQDDNGEIGKRSIMALFLLINENFPGMRYIPDEEAELLFDILDDDDSDSISEEEFLDFQRIMLLHLVKLGGEKKFIDHLLPNLTKTEWYQRFKDYILSEAFNNTIDFLLVLNAILIVYQNLPQITGNYNLANMENIADGKLDSVSEYFQLLFTIAFVLEMITKILVMGWIDYSVQKENMFDFVVTISSFTTTVVVYCFTFFNNVLVIRLVNSVRILRLTRLLASFPQFSVIGQTFFDIAKPASKLVTFLMVIIYTFSAIGLTCFGGFVTRDPQNPYSYLLEGSDFADGRYWPNNFNDMMSGVVVLFNLMLGDSDVQDDAFELVAGTSWTRLYFFAYFIITGIIVSNIVISLIMDKFVEVYEETRSAEDESSIHNSGAVLGNGFTGRYLVKLQEKAFCNSDNDLETLLEAMLSRRERNKRINANIKLNLLSDLAEQVALPKHGN